MFLRELWRMIKTREGRQALAISLYRDMPGKPGYLIRERLYRRAFAAAGEGLVIFEGVRIRNVHLVKVGRDVNIGEQAFFQAGGGIELGDDVLIGPGVKIWTQNHRIDDPDTPIWRQGAVYKPVKIGDDCWLGANCFIMPGTVLGRGCVVGAGAVVGAKHYPDHCMLMGNPARVIGSRRAQPHGEDPS
ncbi:MAG TPA: acyltransferase [Candidatus Krumholzibacteria bacterium]|nr:acyltransferase [Candidatus Krumholzibacteria bacterium]HPD72028.1 acyltransferase [Candidatus Krumholzibacteria bacterium]HRY41039.1 acyltransferase [Candidatus Krumholzibacteria bacterium]